MSASDLKIRAYRHGDLDQMFRLDEACFQPPFRFSMRAMRRFADAANALVIIVDRRDRLAGFCIIHFEQVSSKSFAYVVTLDVAPEQRRNGIATILMREAEAQARTARCAYMSLHVHTGNMTAIRFYERHGYELQGKVQDFYGLGVHALLYRKILGENSTAFLEKDAAVVTSPD